MYQPLTLPVCPLHGCLLTVATGINGYLYCRICAMAAQSHTEPLRRNHMSETADVQKVIQANLDAIAHELDEAIEARDAANERVKALRHKLDTAPRLHVRRVRKSKGEKLVEIELVDLATGQTSLIRDDV